MSTRIAFVADVHPLCACGCGVRVEARLSRTPRVFRKFIDGHRYPEMNAAPLCACGCGRSVGRKGRRWATWLKGCHSRKHGFDAKTAKTNERLLRVYGLDRATYDAMVYKQEGRCALCGVDAPGRGKGMWCVDHCHKTGKVRGLLCTSCNAGLGNLRDDPELLLKAVAYLRRA